MTYYFLIPLKFLQLIFIGISVISSREIGKVCGTKQREKETHAEI
jgi:hypothetical protein